ncbi:MAG: iron ABC transporter permease [Bacteroidales bacterium]|nr:iron ABC transporter permease [Bacteroidales bacterium]MBR6093183.1 iron ABC transporter permease [Bacteroidales bacterium]
MKNKKIAFGILGIIIVGIILFILNLFVGSVTVPLDEIFKVLLKENTDNTLNVIIFNYRLPQALTALLAGAALAVAGLLMQTLFRNPLADPSMLGISSGASLGVGIVILLTGAISGTAVSSFGWWSTIGVSLAAFLGAVLVLFVMLAFSSRMKDMTTLIIIGLMIAYLAGSITDILKFFSLKEDIHAFVIWGMGSFSGVGTSKMPVFATSIIIGLFVTFFLSKNLNILLLGEMYAENLGLNIRKNSVIIILVSGYLTAIVTAYCGPIAFVGLAMPHIARFLFKSSDHRLLIPATMLIGMDMALVCNLIARMPGFDGNLPVNAVTAFIGAPIVISVILKSRK